MALRSVVQGRGGGVGATAVGVQTTAFQHGLLLSIAVASASRYTAQPGFLFSS